MKKNSIFVTVMAFAVMGTLSSCEKYLDREPLSTVSPEVYFKDATQIQAYTDEIYDRILPDVGGNDWGIFGRDADDGTDNQLILDNAAIRFDDGQWRVGQSGGDWSFEVVYRCNYFFEAVLPKFGSRLDGSENTITGNLDDIKHFIGEMYALRALEYFGKYRKFGDFPIITQPLSDKMEELSQASKRSPRNEVARFILSDLDKAIELMGGKDLTTTRINKDVALLLKSRVALYEGTWLKYFKGTAFVPNGSSWPGKAKDYNANYQFPSGSIDDEINWFLDQAVAASKEVAEKYKNQLAGNTGTLQQSASGAVNPYYEMFTSPDLSSVKEVMLWRKFAITIKTHGIAIYLNQGSPGFTRSLVQNFLMADGTPVYAHGTYADGDGYYKGDKTIADVRVNRDSRLSLFLMEPGQKNILDGTTNVGTNIFYEVPRPDVLKTLYGSATGYFTRKGAPLQVAQYITMNGSFTSLPLFRSVEALLNYMEASYERNGVLDGSAREYWQIIRRRAHVSDDIDATIAATQMDKEAVNDWGAYSAGRILSDKILYNIRRERRSEFMSEGIRNIDLCRWRAMDQMKTVAYIPEGMHIWNTPMQSWYTNYVTDGSDKANMSPSSLSEYIRPFQKRKNQRCYNGFVWRMAHYLDPIAVKHFQLTSPDGATIEQSPIYQNPFWPTTADQPATE